MTEYMRIAIKEAQTGIRSNEGGPFGCVIVKDGKIIGRGHNEVVKRNDPTCHGEVMAIRNACGNINNFDLSGCKLYTTAEPCPMCLGAIKWANISKVYYGCNTLDTEEIGFRDKQFYEEERGEEFIVNQDREACLELFEEYKSLENTTNY